MRSLESGRAMLRATNDGVTALIAYDGSVAGRLPQFESGVLRGDVQPRTGLTPYIRLGNVPVLGLIVLGLVAAAVAKRRKVNRA
jgi:apolipoprotein N-acyltransferase